MKKTIFYAALTSLIVSGLFTGIFFFFNPAHPSSSKLNENNAQQAHKVELKDLNVKLGPDFTQVAENVMPGVVHIKAMKRASAYRSYSQPEIPDPFKEFFRDDRFEEFFKRKDDNPSGSPKLQYGQGSGVILTSTGYIVTNNHVVAEAEELEVTLHDNRTFNAKIIGTDPNTDLAVLKIEGENLSTIPFVDSDNVKVGQWVLAVGNPFNLNSTVTAGIVSAKGRNINILREKYAVESFIQTDAAINPGNSGGALVSMEGGLIGINTAIASPTGSYSGYGFAVPANIVQKVVQDIMEYGIVQRGVLGIMIRTVSGNLADEKNLDVFEGVYVDSIMENSAAGEAGIKSGDVITAINDATVNTSPELQEIIARHRPGDIVKVEINRKGKSRSFEVKLKNREGKTKLEVREHRELFNLLGADFKNVDKNLAEKLNIKGGVQVTRLYAGKLKQNTNIMTGFIVTKIDGEPIRNIDDFIEKLENKTGGVMLEGIYENKEGIFYYAIGI